MLLPAFFPYSPLLSGRIDKLEVELFPIEVGTADLHLDAVAEVVAVVVAAAFQTIILLVEVIVIALKVAERYHAFALVLVDFDIKAELRHARDSALEGLAEDAVTEIEALPVLIQSSRGVISVGGIDSGIEVSVYSTDGMKEGSVISVSGQATIPTNMPSGSIAIVRIGNKSVKVPVQ